MLLVVNLREKKVRLLATRPVPVEDKLVKLFLFLRNVVLSHEKRRIEETVWRSIRYEQTPLAAEVSDEDSGMFVLKQAERIATGQPTTLSWSRKDRIKYLKQLYFNRT